MLAPTASTGSDNGARPPPQLVTYTAPSTTKTGAWRSEWTFPRKFNKVYGNSQRYLDRHKVWRPALHPQNFPGQPRLRPEGESAVQPSLASSDELFNHPPSQPSSQIDTPLQASTPLSSLSSPNPPVPTEFLSPQGSGFELCNAPLRSTSPLNDPVRSRPPMGPLLRSSYPFADRSSLSEPLNHTPPLNPSEAEPAPRRPSLVVPQYLSDIGRHGLWSGRTSRVSISTLSHRGSASSSATGGDSQTSFFPLPELIPRRRASNFLNVLHTPNLIGQEALPALVHHTCSALNGLIYIFGGLYGGDSTDEPSSKVVFEYILPPHLSKAFFANPFLKPNTALYTIELNAKLVSVTCVTGDVPPPLLYAASVTLTGRYILYYGGMELLRTVVDGTVHIELKLNHHRCWVYDIVSSAFRELQIETGGNPSEAVKGRIGHTLISSFSSLDNEYYIKSFTTSSAKVHSHHPSPLSSSSLRVDHTPLTGSLPAESGITQPNLHGAEVEYACCTHPSTGLHSSPTPSNKPPRGSEDDLDTTNIMLFAFGGFQLQGKRFVPTNSLVELTIEVLGAGNRGYRRFGNTVTITPVTMKDTLAPSPRGFHATDLSLMPISHSDEPSAPPDGPLHRADEPLFVPFHNKSLAIQGGMDSEGCLGDMWVLTFNTFRWRQIPTFVRGHQLDPVTNAYRTSTGEKQEACSNQAMHTMIRINKYMLLFGGVSQGGVARPSPGNVNLMLNMSDLKYNLPHIEQVINHDGTPDDTQFMWAFRGVMLDLEASTYFFVTFMYEGDDIVDAKTGLYLSYKESPFKFITSYDSIVGGAGCFVGALTFHIGGVMLKSEHIRTGLDPRPSAPTNTPLTPAELNFTNASLVGAVNELETSFCALWPKR